MPEIDGKAFLEDHIVVDLLGGSIGTLAAPRGRAADYGDGPLRAGLTAIHVSIGVYAAAIEPVLDEIYDFDCLFRDMPHRIQAVREVEDFASAKAHGRVGVVLGSQGLDYIGRNTRLLSILQRLGLRIAALTYNERNELASGCLEPHDGGLTLVGLRAVRELRRVGIALDLSHVGHRSSLEAIDAFEGPAMFTHSNAFALTPNPRNIKDDQIKAAAASGGLVGLSPYSAFCRKSKAARPTVEDMADHVDHVVQLVGIDHAAIGTDLFPHTKVKWENGTKRMYPEMVEGIVWETAYAEGFDSQEGFATLVATLGRRGYGRGDLAKLLSGNVIRVLGSAWRGPAPASRGA